MSKQVKIYAGSDTYEKWKDICERFSSNTAAFAVVVENYFNQIQEDTMNTVTLYTYRNQGYEYTATFPDDEAGRVGELCGCASMDELTEWFGGMTDDEILKSCNDCWPSEDNTELASRISSVINGTYHNIYKPE